MSAAPAPDATTLDTVAELLAAVAALPPAARAVARERIEDALDGDARRCRAALGLLALELAPAAAAGRLEEVGIVVDLTTGAHSLDPDLRVASPAPHRTPRPARSTAPSPSATHALLTA